MENQTFINMKMREILIEWLRDLHMNVKTLPETLMLAIRIMDRYIEAVPDIRRDHFQLIGGTCFFLAFKFEETIDIYIPFDEIVYFSDGAYTRDDILYKEIEIIKSLNWIIPRY